MWIPIFFFFCWGGGGGGGRGGHYEIGLFFIFFWGGGGLGVSFLYIIGRFKVKIQNGNIFLGRKFSNILGIPDIPDFLFFLRWGGGVGFGGKQ